MCSRVCHAEADHWTAGGSSSLFARTWTTTVRSRRSLPLHLEAIKLCTKVVFERQMARTEPSATKYSKRKMWPIWKILQEKCWVASARCENALGPSHDMTNYTGQFTFNYPLQCSPPMKKYRKLKSTLYLASAMSQFIFTTFLPFSNLLNVVIPVQHLHGKLTILDLTQYNETVFHYIWTW